MNYLWHLGIYLGIYAIMVLSLNLVTGYCGLLTLAHAGYYAIGGYTYALATLKLGWSFLPATTLAIVVAAMLSFVVSLAACRLKGDYFVLVTLSAQVLIFGVIYNWSVPNTDFGTLQNLTNGASGITGIPKPDLFNMKFESLNSLALLSLGIAGVCAGLLCLLLSSPWGRLLKAMRDDELAARGLGKNTRLAKVQAISLSSGMAAIAGVLYASYVGSIVPSIGSVDQSLLWLCALLVGGAGNFWGPIAGSLIFLLIPEALRFLHLSEVAVESIRLMLFGFILVGMMHFRPQGVAGEYRVE